MIKVITAVEELPQEKKRNDVYVFLAGGIQRCPEWQKKVIENMSEMDFENDVYLINPRRENFPIDDPNASEEQITWEFNMLDVCDIFTMYFAKSESPQPICFYELGRNIERMKMRFSNDWMKRIVITCDKEFGRHQDVVIQTRLATFDFVDVNVTNDDDDMTKHTEEIVKCVKNYFDK